MIVTNGSKEKTPGVPLSQSCRTANGSTIYVGNTRPGSYFGSGLMYIEIPPDESKRNVALTASGVMDVTSGRYFHILVANFGDRSPHLPKNMLVTVGGEADVCIVQMAWTITRRQGTGINERRKKGPRLNFPNLSTTFTTARWRTAMHT